MDCPNEACRQSLNPANAATNFSNPVLAVKRAIQTGLISEDDIILEVGAGNLRNALYVLQILPTVRYYAFDIPQCVARFLNRYREFREKGGTLLESDWVEQRDFFNVVICSFVLETICPTGNRIGILRSIINVLRRNGVLIVSFRGYPGVKGSRYRYCEAGEGLITPLKTFVKPYSLPEAKDLLMEAGFQDIRVLERYRVDSPQNIHLAATIREK